MDCKAFYRVFSEYHDGAASDDVVRSVEEHLSTCARCREYRRVVDEGVAVLRRGGDVPVPDDFEARLRHRIFMAREEDALLNEANSGATALAVLSIALVLTAVVWSPLLRPGTPQVELAPLVVSTPPAAPMRFRALAAYPFGGGPAPTTADRSEGLFDDAHQLLFEYSRLSQRYRQRALVRQAGFEPDR